MNLAYNKCIHACSGPPTYLSTGRILLITSGSNCASAFLLSGYLKQYHDEHTKVSNVSASLLAGLPQAPSAYALNSNYEKALERQKQVIEALNNLSITN